MEDAERGEMEKRSGPSDGMGMRIKRAHAAHRRHGFFRRLLSWKGSKFGSRNEHGSWSASIRASPLQASWRYITSVICDYAVSHPSSIQVVRYPTHSFYAGRLPQSRFLPEDDSHARFRIPFLGFGDACCCGCYAYCARPKPIIRCRK